MRFIAVANQKGGVGKTTVALNLSASLAARGHEVVAIDLDPQGNLGQGLGIETDGSKDTPLYDALLYGKPIKPAIQETGIEGLTAVPSDGACLELAEARLGERLDWAGSVGNLADRLTSRAWVILDCRPSLGPLTLSALGAAELVIAPITPGRYALEGLAGLMSALARIKGPKPRILVNQLDRRSKATGRWLDEQLGPFRDLLMQTVIPRNESINQAGIAQQPVIRFAPRSAGALAFKALAQEVEGLCP